MIRVGGAPAIGGPGEDVVFHGLVYPDGDEISKHMAERLRREPFYQHDKLKQALDLVKHRRAAIDCGAWVGGWSRELARNFRNVVAIEASPDNARCVVKNTAAAGNVTVRCCALGDTDGAAVTVERKSNEPCVGSRIVSEQPFGAVTVPIYRLDSVPGVLQMPAVDYIKIHVNGMELKALRGAVQTITRHRPVLTVVLKPAIEAYGDTVQRARDFLTAELRYRPAGGERPYEIWLPA